MSAVLTPNLELLQRGTDLLRPIDDDASRVGTEAHEASCRVGPREETVRA